MLMKLFVTAMIIHAIHCKTAEQWRSRSIYQLLTDRFSPSHFNYSLCVETPLTEYSVRHYCGGTYRGIIDQLDYIIDMGFDAIWISPIPSNTDVETIYGVGWHGYWQDNIYKLNEHFGTEQDLIYFIEKAHERNVWVMLDVVANHVGPNVTAYIPFDREEHFHQPLCFIEDFKNQTQLEFCSIGSPQSVLPDLNTENPFVISTFFSWINETVQKYGFDAIRIDTFRHVRPAFWKEYNQIAGVYSIGEVASDDTPYVASYQNVADAVLHYPLFFTLIKVFNDNPLTREGMTLLEIQVKSNQQHFKDTTVCGTFLDNHDQDRFLNHTQNPIRIQNALTYLMFSDGIPILYMGMEQNLTGNPTERYGAGDPWNRDPMWRTGYNRLTWIYRYLTTLGQVRKFIKQNYADDFFVSTQKTIYVDQDIYVYQKGPVYMMIFNQPFPVSKIIPFDGTDNFNQFTDLLSNQTYQLNDNRELKIDDWNPLVLLPIPSSAILHQPCVTVSMILFLLRKLVQ